MGTMARTAVVAGTATAVAGNVRNRQQAGAQQQAAQQQAPQPTPQDDMLAQLAKLGQLKSAGLLDDAEFAAAKAKLLGI